MRRLARRLRRSSALLCFAGAATIGVRAADRMALWRIVHDKCVPDQKANGAPAPCARVDLAGGEDSGVAILKDLHGVAQHLAIPTRRVAGIESPAAPRRRRAQLLARGLGGARHSSTRACSANCRAMRSASPSTPRAGAARTSCTFISIASRPTCATRSPPMRGELDADWHVLPFTLAGRRYWARRLDSADLSDAAPFRLLADGVAGARSDMAHETLVAIGATSRRSTPGFVLLADHADLTAAAMARICWTRPARSPARRAEAAPTPPFDRRSRSWRSLAPARGATVAHNLQPTAASMCRNGAAACGCIAARVAVYAFDPEDRARRYARSSRLPGSPMRWCGSTSISRRRPCMSRPAMARVMTGRFPRAGPAM